ncbi:MAG TPA: hypothetical protein VK324_15255 [Tepidisphaeraceae bacterium]|nr:hypothetical protein [Tepidisphaeraceae bacterium]
MKWSSRSVLMMIVGALVAAAGGGCREQLETGYQYRRLSASPGERKAYYAPAFSPEAQAAQAQRQDDFRARRPGGGY